MITEAEIASYIIVIAIFARIMYVRISRSIRGAIFRRSRVLRGPVFYAILSVLFIFGLSGKNYDVYATLLLIPVGLLIGFRFGESASFFMKNNLVYYKRNPAIVIFWISALFMRIAIEFLYPGLLIAEVVIDILLALTCGLITGEAIHILDRERAFESQKMTDNY